MATRREMESTQAAAKTTGQKPKRKYRKEEEKRRIVEETLIKGASVALVARAHGVNANQVFSWRRRYAQELGGGSAKSAKLLPVTISAETAENNSTKILPGIAIEIELPKGRLRIVGADAALLRAAMEMLQ